ncbi:DUF4197 domain-containing protein [endosymbiont of unidentified scaly snail isolate Monju]|uniref:DUF4197 domain-containing protein n=1 Tax=endosymbiont of unidentified scaly snail isolate Monju TaxID=1248727 RepID=UPI000389263A|nr:DUF4197 domain-containing protein [endosymbiont of unidentified scaly snail isolate Monju]BAN69590.1 conserved hypothetical protein [endosymbiont of unidentified scaly snail isolate Monju]
MFRFPPPYAVTLVFALSLCLPARAGFQDLMKSAGGLLDDSGGMSLPGVSSQAGSGLRDGQIDAGLKEALAVGAERAVAQLGRSGGFLNDPKVRIPLPGVLGRVADTARRLGQGQRVDALEQAVNRAAEQAIPKTLAIVKQTVRRMTLEDARGILSGGDDAATRYLRDKAGDSLRRAVRPIVARATDEAGATAAYKRLLASTRNSLGGLGGLLGGQVNLDLDDYVTEKALNGLFLKLAAEEKAIRTNPVARSTELLKQVFGR